MMRNISTLLGTLANLQQHWEMIINSGRWLETLHDDEKHWYIVRDIARWLEIGSCELLRGWQNYQLTNSSLPPHSMDHSRWTCGKAALPKLELCALSRDAHVQSSWKVVFRRFRWEAVLRTWFPRVFWETVAMHCPWMYPKDHTSILFESWPTYQCS